MDDRFICPVCGSLMQVFTAEPGPYVGCGECLFADLDHHPAGDITAEQDHVTFRPEGDPRYEL